MKLQAWTVRYLPLSPGLKRWCLSAAGPFTIFFWAPSTKWVISLANVGDLIVPPQNLSVPQQTVIVISGFTWCVYAFRMYPFSWNFLAVQAFMALTGVWQLGRWSVYQLTHKD